VTRDVVFRPQAEDEALEVRRWYEARREGLGNEFGAEVDEMVARIAGNPLAFQRVRGNTRRGVLKNFPYAILFPGNDQRDHRPCDSRQAGSVALADSIVTLFLPQSSVGHAV